MSALIETLNLFGQRFVDFALPMLIQSSLLIAFLLTLDLVLRKHARAVIRYGLWMLVLIKLVLPPSFASPTGLGYWLPAKQAKPPEQPIIAPAPAQFTVSYSEAETIYVPSTTPPPIPRYTPSLTWPAILLLGWATVTIALFIWLVLRARFVTRMSARASDAPESLVDLLQSCRQQMDIQQSIRLKFSTEATSPAVCSLWRPTILIPVLLVDKLSTLRMRAVLLHELAHIKRGDLWMNYAQTLLQIFYWYNPLLWLANAIIRRVREQAVDEMVMVEMGQHANAYPTTLLEVAKLTFTRSVLSLGLVGIMESKGALKQRIQTLLSRPIPKLARLGWKGLTCVSLVGLITLPMASHPKANALEPTKPSQPTARIAAADITLSHGVFKYDTNKFLTELRAQTRLSDSSSLAEEQEALRKLFANAGAELKPPAGMVREHGTISIHATVTEMEVVKQVLLKLDPGLKLALFPASNPRTNSFGASNGHQTIVNKLDSIRLDSVLYDGMPLYEVVKNLNLEARKHDPEGLGITFFIETETSATRGTWYITTIPITIKPTLKNVRLVDVLDAIVRVAPQSISYEIGNSTVAFLAGTPAQRLHLHSFWVNTNMFIPALQRLAGQPPSKNMTELLKGFRDFLETLGASFLPPKEISYVDDRHGHLMVIGTANDLVIVEKAIKDLGALSVAPTFVEGVSAPIPRFVPAVVLPTNTAIGDELFRNDLGTSSVGDTKAPPAGQPIRTTNEAPMRAKDKVPVLGDLPLIGRFFRPESPPTNHVGAISPTTIPDVQDPILTVPSRKTDAGTLVHEGRLLYELGMLDEAEAKFNQALKDDPGNLGANYYLNLIREKKYSNLDRERSPVVAPNPYALTNLIHTSKGRQAILLKLDRIRLKEVHFDSLPLSDVIKILNIETRKRDPDKIGVNFIINPQAEALPTPGAFPGVAPVIDPLTGLPANATVNTSKPVDVNSVAITINPAITDVRLADVLDAILKVADKPIQYSVGDYGIIFSAKTSETPPLFTRFFKVDPKTFYKGLESVGEIGFGEPPTNSGRTSFDARQSRPDNIQADMRAFFAAAGVVLNPPKALFFNVGQGMLMVRGTLQDLGIVESALQTLNVAPPQITIETKFIEVSEQIAKELWRAVPVTNIIGTNSWTSILTWAQREALQKQLAYLPGDVLTAPKVTTLSGRQARIEVMTTNIVKQAIDPQALKPPGVSSKSNGEASLYLTQELSFGPHLDVISYVGSDGWEIELSVDATVTEFLGYVFRNKAKSIPVWIDGEEKQVTPTEPFIRTRRLHTDLSVRDGQTLMVGNPLDASSQIVEQPGDGQKRLIVLVTPTIIDPVGNRLHADNEIPPENRK